MAGEAYAVLVTSGFADTLDLDDSKIARNLARAINRGARYARPEAARRMREQVNFPARYLSSSEGRLQQTKAANPADLMAVITGRHRPTSLARFASNARKSGQTGVRLTVDPGSTSFLPRAFFINLRSGTDGSNNNLGVAIRLPKGQRPSRAYKPKRLGANLWLLYGPSVDQVFDDVALDISDDTADVVETEFLRLTDLDLA